MTLDYYNKNAKLYSQETTYLDFKNQQEILLKYLEPGAHILDLGCGAGRDSKAFIDLGYKVTAIDGSSELCKIASKYTGQQVECRKFQDIDEVSTYDAVWACASLLHLRFDELPDILTKINRSLKPGGYFYSSFKHGEFEGKINGRYYTYLNSKKLDNILSNCKSFNLIESTITRDVRNGYENGKWLNIILRKTSKYS